MQMKIAIILLVCAFTPKVLASPVEWSEDGRKIEREQIQLWRGIFERSTRLPSEEYTNTLADGLRKMGHWKSFDNHSPEVDELFEKIQKELLMLPNLPQSYVDSVETERLNLKPRDHTGKYDSFRHLIINEILVHLPSPDTVKVLGDYLSDERDFEAAVLAKNAVCAAGGRASNSQLAVNSLRQLGIRNPPVTRTDYTNYGNSEPWKIWYEKIKTGVVTFSFVGQKVEYRFKPDGTWETLAMDNPPDDGPRPTKPINTNGQRPDKKQNPFVASQELKPLGNSLPWIVGAIVFLISGAAWVAVRNVFSNSR